MNRNQRRIQKKANSHLVATLPDKLTPVPLEERPPADPRNLIDVYWNKRFLVQMYQAGNLYYPEMIRLSVNRVKIQTNGKWEENITWEELQSVKRELGFGEWYGVEVYPPDEKIVNVANMRHLWIMPNPLAIGWI